DGIPELDLGGDEEEVSDGIPELDLGGDEEEPSDGIPELDLGGDEDDIESASSLSDSGSEEGKSASAEALGVEHDPDRVLSFNADELDGVTTKIESEEPETALETISFSLDEEASENGSTKSDGDSSKKEPVRDKSDDDTVIELELDLGDDS
ncbi:MAG: hypothetical protein HQL50_12815, partial [Magnetococcales bacterium]|nr:hypothetical protein [Magnetococcales bacterium]